MLDYFILSKKATVKAVKDGKFEQYKDLLSKSYNPNQISDGRVVYVEKYYTARPDLISLAVYGNDKYADMICKVNGISNPFELNEGMLLYIPDIDSLNRAFASPGYESDILDEFKTLNNANPFNLYSSNYNREKSTEETIEKKKKNLQKYKNEKRTPGDQTINDSNYTIDRSLGVVIY